MREPGIPQFLLLFNRLHGEILPMDSGRRANILIIGGGAAGFFAAITAAELHPESKVVLMEKGGSFLSKVKISGGGRCNVTHACFEPRDLATRYPRGGRELKGAFFHWQPRDTLDWFEKRGVRLKTEVDGRIFPVSDDSTTIVGCLIEAARQAGVTMLSRTDVQALRRTSGGFEVETGDESVWYAEKVGVMVGSLKESPLLRALQSLGHSIAPLAPSLFAFHVQDPRFLGLQGLAVEDVEVFLPPKGHPQRGPLLITHQGVSGPAVLKLSAWEARSLQAVQYRFEFGICWLPGQTRDSLIAQFAALRDSAGRRTVRNSPLTAIPRRLWERLIESAGIGPDVVWAQITRNLQDRVVDQLLQGRYSANGKTMNKEEFVTCGGVDRREVDFKTMESRLVPGLYFGGECLDLDGVTGGFNLQAAWTTGYLAGKAMARPPEIRPCHPSHQQAPGLKTSESRNRTVL
jgi:predicted Rossmann fold flavoprotein